MREYISLTRKAKVDLEFQLLVQGEQAWIAEGKAYIKHNGVMVQMSDAQIDKVIEATEKHLNNLKHARRMMRE